MIPELAKHPDFADEFWAHNAMMMIREAQGDPAAALAENDQATLAAARGTWDQENRETLAYLKDRWHRAYLTRMLAESRKGSVKQGLVQYAEAALDDYRRRAARSVERRVHRRPRSVLRRARRQARGGEGSRGQGRSRQGRRHRGSVPRRRRPRRRR